MRLGYAARASRSHQGEWGGWLRPLLVATLLACAMLAGAAPGKALADEVGNLVVGADIDYAGYNTTWMSVDGNAAYCATPMFATPRSGPYAKSPISAPSGRNAETVADLWFGFGSPGFDATLWPSTWYDGTAMTDARYAALTHILLSDTYSSSSASALYGCSAAFRSWAQRNVIGFDSQGTLINGSATGRLIVERTGEVPATFSAFQISTGTATQCVLSFSYEARGSLELMKVSARPNVTDGNPLYSIEGARFGVFRDEACTDLARSLTCDSTGRARSGDLPTGTYWVKELEAPLHMTANDAVYRTEVKDRQTSQVNGGRVENMPQTGKLDVLLRKIDAESRAGLPQGDASLANAVLTVRYYPQLDSLTDLPADSLSEGSEGVVGNADFLTELGDPLFTWRFKTDELGEIHLSDAQDASRYLIGGDELPRDSMGFCALPLGTYVIEETEAPQGYERNPQIEVIAMRPDGTGEHDCIASFATGESAAAGVTVADRIRRGGLSVTKIDAELGKPEAVGGNPEIEWAPTLSGVRFEIANASTNNVLVDGTWFEPGQVIGMIEATWDEGAEEFRAQTASDALPFGTYTVREAAASNGYLLSDGTPRTVEVRAEGELATVNDSGEELTFANQVIRNDLELLKIRDGDEHPLQVAFSLTNLATGEQHALVCDKEGKASTENTFAAHTGNTNGNDCLLAMERIAASDMDPSAGVWFGRGSNGEEAPARGDLAALPYGQYLLEELPCDTNEGYDLVSGLITIDSNSSESPTVSATVVNHAITIDEPENTSEKTSTEKARGTLAETGDRVGLPATQLLGIAALAALALVAACVKGSARHARGGRYQRRRRRR